MQADLRDAAELADAVFPQPQRHGQDQQYTGIAKQDLNGAAVRHICQCLREGGRQQDQAHLCRIEQQQRDLAAFLLQLPGPQRIPHQQQQMRDEKAALPLEQHLPQAIQD